jgi:NitT/TauT family transport system substrate-binding protein
VARLRLFMNRRTFGCGVLALPALIRSASAQTTTVRVGKQYGLPFLPQMVMEEQKLIEKHAAQQGIPGLKAEWLTMSGPGALNDALLGGQMEFVNVAAPSLGTLWDKTFGTPIEVHGLCAVQSMPYVLCTRNAAVKTIADFTPNDRIAVPTVKISGQAMALQMAAAKLWGPDQYERLDALTVSMAHPDAMQAMLSGRSEITGHFAVSPFHYYELATPGIHQVLKSYDTLGGKHTNGIQVATRRFHEANPRICAAVLNAHNEANAFINAHPRDAAQIYVALTKDRRNPVDELARMVADPDVDYTTTPANVMTLIEFMHRAGRIKRMPGSWKELFFADVHGVQGS